MKTVYQWLLAVTKPSFKPSVLPKLDRRLFESANDFAVLRRRLHEENRVHAHFLVERKFFKPSE